MARHKLSRDQKRKQKLAQRKRGPDIQPYEGNKYRSERFVDALLHAETAIYEAYVVGHGQLTDREVEQSLDYMILKLRGEKPTPPVNHSQVEIGNGEKGDLVASFIERRWEELFADRPRHSNSDLSGVLRTILSSIKTRSHPSPNSQSYLQFLEKFLKNIGVRVEAVRRDEMEHDECYDEQ
jgi:hypothetical protein